MPDGLVMMGMDAVGVYTIFVDGTIRINLDDGKDVKETLEHLSQEGISLNLLAVPFTDNKE